MAYEIRHNRHRWLLPLSLVVLCFAWGVTWIVAKQALNYAAPFTFATERCIGGSIALFAAMKIMRRPIKLVAPTLTLTIGLAQVAGFMLFQIWALVEGGPGKTSVLIFTMPIWTVLLGWPILGERIRGQQSIAAIGTLLGLVLIIQPWDMQTNLFSKFLGIMAALCWSIGTILIKYLRTKYPVDLLSLTLWQMIFGSIALILLTEIIPEPATHWSMSYLGILVFTSIISTALCWWLWITILDRVPAWEASLSVLGTPVIAIVLSRLTLGEHFKLAEIAGILLIGSGLALLSFFSWASSRRQRLPIA